MLMISPNRLLEVSFTGFIIGVSTIDGPGFFRAEPPLFRFHGVLRSFHRLETWLLAG